MISYPEANYVQNFSVELLDKTKELPLYLGGPAVDYTEANHAFALCATLLYDSRRNPEELLSNGPSEAAQILLVERASGHGRIGSFSGVTGYIDTVRNLDGEDGAFFDPIAHTLREELVTECGFTAQSFDLVSFYAGKLTVEDRTFRVGSKITVVPILGLCVRPPEISINQSELASYQWVELRALKYMKSLARGYLDITLPSALGALGVREEAFAKLLA